MTSAASGEDRIGDGKGRDEDRQRLARRNSSRPTGVLSAGSTRVCPPGGLVTVSIRSTAATRAARRGRRLVHPAVSNVLDRHRNGPSSSAHAATDHPCAASWRTASRPLPETPLVTTASFRKRTCDSLGRCGSDRDVADGGVAAGEQGHRDGGTGRARPGRRHRAGGPRTATLPAGGNSLAGEDAHERGLACAVAAEQPGDRPPSTSKVTSSRAS